MHQWIGCIGVQAKADKVIATTRKHTGTVSAHYAATLENDLLLYVAIVY